jgi:hypothetical protein
MERESRVSKYTALYQEDEEGLYVLLLVTSRTFNDLPERELWLVELAQELAGGDLWAIRMVEAESLIDLPPILSAEE